MSLRRIVLIQTSRITNLVNRVESIDDKFRERFHKLEKENKELKELLYPEEISYQKKYFNWLFNVNDYGFKNDEKKRSRIDILEEKLESLTKMLGVKIEHDKRDIDEYVVKGTPNSRLTIIKTTKKKTSRKR